jgi:asparagine synthase (glutamine-hydrolysing)
VSGICGWIDWRGTREPGPHRALDAMLGVTPHRGPDGTGRWIQDGVGLAHQAFHLTPDSAYEVQPLADADAGLVLVADVRLDNRDSLVRQLGLGGQRPDGAGPRSKGDDVRPPKGGPRPITDAEILLAAYAAWGRRCAERLVGDFAFAIWDRRARSLFAARDPMAMRGLYLRPTPGNLALATEAGQLLAIPGEAARPFEPAVALFLAGEFGAPEWTFYQGIEELPPAHALWATADGVERWRYWDGDPSKRIRYRRDEEYAEHFRELFLEAVRARLRTRRPVGVLLSGGMDSGSIAASAGWLQERGEVDLSEITAFSWTFTELTQCDERHISGDLADRFRIPVVEVPTDDAWPLRNFPEEGPDVDEPFYFGHQTALERSFGVARDHGVQLMLSGDRGDLVAGMSIFDFPSLVRTGRWVRLVREVRQLARARGVTQTGVIRNELLRPARITLLPPHSAATRLPGLRRLAHPTPPRIPEWIPRELAERTELDELLAKRHHPPVGGGLARQERHEAVFAPLHMRGVTLSERVHARFGQGFADPWSDRRLAEFALAVPQRVLNRVGEPKRLTRMAMQGIIPDDVLDRIRKIPPTPLFERGLRERERSTVLGLFSDSRSSRRGWIDDQALRRYYLEYTESGGEASLLWPAITTEMWLRRHRI